MHILLYNFKYITFFTTFFLHKLFIQKHTTHNSIIKRKSVHLIKRHTHKIIMILMIKSSLILLMIFKIIKLLQILLLYEYNNKYFFIRKMLEYINIKKYLFHEEIQMTNHMTRKLDSLGKSLIQMNLTCPNSKWKSMSNRDGIHHGSLIRIQWI